MAKSGQRTSHIRQPVHLSGTTTIGTPSSPAASTPLGQKAMQIPQPLHQLVNTACGRPPTLVWSFTEPFVLAGAARALAAVAPGSRAAEVPLTSPWGVSGSATAAPIPPGCPAFEETVFAGSSSLSFGNTTPPRGARRIAQPLAAHRNASPWIAPGHLGRPNAPMQHSPHPFISTATGSQGFRHHPKQLTGGLPCVAAAQGCPENAPRAPAARRAGLAGEVAASAGSLAPARVSEAGWRGRDPHP